MTILTIKLGALGDVILAEGALRAIRAHHPQERHIVVTQPAFRSVIEQLGQADEVIGAERAKWYQIGQHLELWRTLKPEQITRVYDLQLNHRTTVIRHLLRAPEWSGVGRGVSHPHPLATPKSVHSVERHRLQLRAAGIAEIPDPSVTALSGTLDDLSLPERYALLVPGAAPSRPLKRWPAENYAKLAQLLADDGTIPILLGTTAEAEVTGKIAAAEPRAYNLTGRTSLGQIASLARAAQAAVGNDTGPMHIISLTDCPVVSLFGPDSKPELHRPLGAHVSVLNAPSLADISPEAVFHAVCQKDKSEYSTH